MKRDVSWVLFFLAASIPWTCSTNHLSVIEIDGNYTTETKFTLDHTKMFLVVFPTSQSLFPYRITAWSPDAIEFSPVLVVVRQEKEVLSWQVPFLVDTSLRNKKLLFRNTSRTLCHNNMNKITKKSYFSRLPAHELSQDFMVSLSTSALKHVDVFLKVEEERDFYVETDRRYSLTVSPSQTRYVYYKFPNNKTDTVILEISSNDDVCLTVSIQDSYCPVFDLDKDITYEGKYQTINRKGGMSIRRREYPDGFFLVFVAKSDNYECSQEFSIFPKKNTIVVLDRNSTLEFKISKGITGKGYGVASLITLGAILGFFVVAIIMVFVFNRWGTISKLRKQKSTQQVDNCWNGPPESEEVSVESLTREDRKNILNKKDLTVNLLARDTNKNRRRSYNYLWHILSIAIFYSIPVVQLVVTYQRVVNSTGNQDMCYYNFLCANPAWGLSDFNHFFSNVGYVLIGIFFLGVVVHRHAVIPYNSNGVPVQYGVFYAMGIALIIEGVLSACYHICPSQSNYQFDTSFMYVMAVLCMVKLYQNRHPDVNATAYATFTVLGLTIFLAMIGILNASLGIWIAFVIIYAIMCIYLSFKIYFVSFVFDGFSEFKQAFTDHGFKIGILAPIKKLRFILLLVANITNYAMLISGLFLYKSGATDFGTFLLGLLMANAILYACFYICMKLVSHERVCFEAIIYGFLGVATWMTATYFFLDYATLWTVTPAESRQWNQECILLNFYDKHDVWHLLSAPALFFSFMLLLSLDDDLVDKKRTEIVVF